MAKDNELLYNRIVVKFGTSLLTGGSDRLNPEIMSSLINQIAGLHKQGLELTLVSSGAIASGRQKTGLSKKIKGIPFKQMLAAIGQNHLMYTYEQLFSKHNITIAQALLTRHDLSDRAGYLNARNTLLALLELKVICIVNENDVVAVDELKEDRFGDNDNLSAMVANLVDADLLLLLTDIDGLYTADPRCNPDARLIPEVRSINAEIEGLASGTTGKLGTGGMVTKIEAAKLAAASGVTMVIANGREKDIISRVVSGEKLGTKFLPAVSKLESRKRWMLSGLCTRGKLLIDAGATIAIKKERGSLLAAGIQKVEGEFQRGDIVEIFDPHSHDVGYGLTNYGSADIDAIRGKHSKQITDLLGYEYGAEVVHRNNLVVI